MFLGPGFTQRRACQLKDKLCSLKNKGEFKNSDLQIYVDDHKKIFQQMQNFNANGFAGINIGTHVHFFLSGI